MAKIWMITRIYQLLKTNCCQMDTNFEERGWFIWGYLTWTQTIRYHLVMNDCKKNREYPTLREKSDIKIFMLKRVSASIWSGSSFFPCTVNRQHIRTWVSVPGSRVRSTPCMHRLQSSALGQQQFDSVHMVWLLKMREIIDWSWLIIGEHLNCRKSDIHRTDTFRVHSAPEPIRFVATHLYTPRSDIVAFLMRNKLPW